VLAEVAVWLPVAFELGFLRRIDEGKDEGSHNDTADVACFVG
jgi:hypothetical protein